MEIDLDENSVGYDSDTMKINHHIKIEDALRWMIMTDKNIHHKYISTPRVKKGHQFSEKLCRISDLWHGVEFTVPVQNVEIYIETLSDRALEDPDCTDTTKQVLFTAETAQSWFPEEPYPMLIHPMSNIWVKFEYKFPLPMNGPNQMIHVIHHVEHMTTKNREQMLGCPVRTLTQTRADRVITSQWENFSLSDLSKK